MGQELVGVQSFVKCALMYYVFEGDLAERKNIEWTVEIGIKTSDELKRSATRY